MHLDLDLLGALDDLHLQFLLADLLAGPRLLELIRELGFGATRVCLPVVRRLLDAEIALGFGDLRVRFEPGRLPGTVRLSLSDARVPLRLGLSDVRVARGLSLADLRVAPDLSGPRAAQRLEVPLLVLDVPEREADDLEAHVRHVGAGHLPHPLGEGLPVLVDLLHRQGAEHGALVPLEGLKRDLCDLIGAFPEELLRRES